jgi:hypothetical protein
LSSLIFHSSFVSRTLAVLKIFSSVCQLVRSELKASVNQSALQQEKLPNVKAKTAAIVRIPRHLRLNRFTVFDRVYTQTA